MWAGLVLRKQRICLLSDGTPKVLFGELLRSESFSEQGVEFLWRSSETGYGALFNRCQCGFDEFLNRIIGTTAEDGLESTLLFRGEMDRHGVVTPVLPFGQGRGKTASGQVE
jgi:hypothetical protein